MPTELMTDFMGKVCSISMIDGMSAITGKILAVEDNWIKVRTKDASRLINSDMVMDIKILPDKYQKD